MLIFPIECKVQRGWEFTFLIPLLIFPIECKVQPVWEFISLIPMLIFPMNVKFNGGRNLYSFKIPKKLCGRTGGFARKVTEYRYGKTWVSSTENDLLNKWSLFMAFQYLCYWRVSPVKMPLSTTENSERLGLTNFWFHQQTWWFHYVYNLRLVCGCMVKKSPFFFLNCFCPSKSWKPRELSMNSQLMNECHMKIAQSTWNCFFNPPKWIVYLHDPQYQHPRTLKSVLDLDERWYPTNYKFINPINMDERERERGIYTYISTIKFINPRTIVVINISMAISGSQNCGTVPYTAIFWGDLPWN